ncbi:hypothetical protein RUND412_007233 [Rhizina undulata]
MSPPAASIQQEDRKRGGPRRRRRRGSGSAISGPESEGEDESHFELTQLLRSGETQEGAYAKTRDTETQETIHSQTSVSNLNRPKLPARRLREQQNFRRAPSANPPRDSHSTNQAPITSPAGIPAPVDPVISTAVQGPSSSSSLKYSYISRPPPPSPPLGSGTPTVTSQHPPESAPEVMKATHFPLLRSSPAAGTGSYGALPNLINSAAGSSYAGSTSSRSTGADEGLHMDSARESSVARDYHRDSNSDSEEDRGLLTAQAGKAKMKDSERRRRRLSLEVSRGLPEIRSKDGGGAEEPLMLPPEEVVDVEGSDGEDEDENDPWDNSLYPEVRASVLATDDITMSINTPRMWTLAILFSLLGSATNLFFSLRYPSISITPVIALLLAHPLGKLWDGIFPECSEREEELGGKGEGRWRGIKRWLGKGRWNRKEHACVYISSNVSFGFAFATDVIVEQTHFYHQNPGIMYQILLTLSTQILGYTFAGLTRQWLVYPGAMIWPATLMSTAMFTTLHGEENKVANGWRVSRWRFFMLVFIGGFAWYFLPGLLMPALSYFNVVTWFAPKNVVVANLFGVTSGLGMFPLTFDWAQISYIGSPLMTPFWAAANVVSGLVLVMWILAPIMYYTNTLYGAYMPILSSGVFDNTGKSYDVSKILTKEFLFDEEAYKRYSKVFMPVTYVLSYGLQFAALTALVTHTICWHGKDILRQWGRVRREYSSIGKGPSVAGGGTGYSRISEGRRRKRSKRRRSSLSDREWEEGDWEDVHMRLMRRYKEAPAWWYLVTFAGMIAVGIFVVEYYPVYLPWYGLLLALGVCGLFFIPIGIVMAITNQQSSLFLICQLICGTIFPGRPVANMVFVTYGYITSTQGLKFASDLKLGHYMKIPPRLLFSVQMVATLVSSLTQIGVLNWMFANIPGICTSQAMNGFTCPIARVHFNGSILWGVVGPQRFFGRGEMYRPLIWAFVVGAVAPVAIWGVWRWRGAKKGSVERRVSLPVVFGSLSWIPPATGLNFSSWAIVCYAFNQVLKRRASDWWGKYTMTLSAALDAGLAFGLVVVFFAFVYPGWMEGFTWWGTEIYKQGCDWNACPLLKVQEGGKFGPGKW